MEGTYPKSLESTKKKGDMMFGNDVFSKTFSMDIWDTISESKLKEKVKDRDGGRTGLPFLPQPKPSPFPTPITPNIH